MDERQLSSPSSRRAWIEIMAIESELGTGQVALLAEGVDRNAAAVCQLRLDVGRPPRGGRG